MRRILVVIALAALAPAGAWGSRASGRRTQAALLQSRHNQYSERLVRRIHCAIAATADMRRRMTQKYQIEF